MPQRISTSVSWAASAAANTENIVAGTIEEKHGVSEAVVMIHNPSTVTALSVTPRIRFTDSGGTIRTATLADTAAFTVAANTTSVKRVPGVMGIPDLSIKNNTALGVGQGFTAQVVVAFT